MVLLVICCSVNGFKTVWTIRTVSAEPRAESGSAMLFLIKKLLTFVEPQFK